VWLASGGWFTDALAAAYHVARSGGVLLLVDERHWSTSDARGFALAHAGDVQRTWLVGRVERLPLRVEHDLHDLVHPQPAPPQQGGVVLHLGEDLQAQIDRHPAGTHFVLEAGVHRGQVIAPRDGDRFTGAPGAVLSGAVALDPSAFRQEGPRWVVGGQTAERPADDASAEMDPGQEMDAVENDLWADDARLEHVASRDAVDRPGTWHFDYSRDEVVVFDDPRSFGRLELATAPWAFRSVAANVVIEHLTIERYANAAQTGAVRGERGRHWVVQHSTVQENHAGGIRIGPGMVVRHNRIVRNGQIGVAGVDHDASGFRAAVDVSYNEIAHNRELG
jgi:hypothetical protein